MTSELPVLDLDGVSVQVDGATILHRLTWRVAPGERWVVLGPNGAGKTTLLRLASLFLHPSRGTVQVLGETLGRTDVRGLRRRIGLVSPSMTDLLRPTMTATDLVVSALHGALVPWWITTTDADRAAADSVLARFGVTDRADRPFATLSSGERQRVLLARAFVTDPEIVLLDEPVAGLDLGARESLIAELAHTAADPTTPPLVLVTHHPEEIPPGITHALLLRAGRCMASGTIATVMTDELLTEAFATPLSVSEDGGRWRAVGPSLST
jgi:iron complex transport system ATP-binding protein